MDGERERGREGGREKVSEEAAVEDGTKANLAEGEWGRREHIGKTYHEGAPGATRAYATVLQDNDTI